MRVWGFDIIRGRSVIDVLKVSGLTTDAVVMGLVAAPPPAAADTPSPRKAEQVRTCHTSSHALSEYAPRTCIQLRVHCAANSRVRFLALEGLVEERFALPYAVGCLHLKECRFSAGKQV